MKHKYLLLIISVFFINLTSVIAQEKKQFDIEGFKKKKAEFIISEAQLTEKESTLFIPLVNELMDKQFQLHRAVKKETHELRNKKNKTDLDYDRLIQADFENRTKELNLEKEYYEKFKKVLSSEKIYKYQKAENKFMKKMVNSQKNKTRASKK